MASLDGTDDELNARIEEWEACPVFATIKEKIQSTTGSSLSAQEKQFHSSYIDNVTERSRRAAVVQPAAAAGAHPTPLYPDREPLPGGKLDENPFMVSFFKFQK